MTLSKHKLGEFVETFAIKCNNPNLLKEDVSGINKDKEFFEPSSQIGSNTSKYKVVPPGHFACNLMHVGRDKVLPIAENTSNKDKYVSPAYTTFSFKRNSFLLKEYFFIKLKCNELDRFFWFNTDGSVRDGMNWKDFCDVEIELPPLQVQRKFVDIYNAMIKNQKAYENGIEDLKLVCDAYIEELRRNMLCEKIGPYIKYIDIRNEKDEFKTARGVSSEGKFIDSRAKLNGVNLKKYKIVNKKQFAYNPSRINLGSIALSTERCIISPMYITFEVDENKLIPEYLMLWLNRKEFHRSTLFYATGSVRDVFDYQLMEEVEIPIPDKKTQKSIADVYLVYENRRSINKQLKSQISDICPILIKGSLEEGKNYEEGKKA